MIKRIMAFVLSLALIYSCDKDDEVKSTKAEILSFSVKDVKYTISDKKIVHTYPMGTDLTALAPVIEISKGATVAPASGEIQDLSGTVTYTVTAEDGKTQTAYTVDIISSSFLIKDKGIVKLRASHVSNLESVPNGMKITFDGKTFTVVDETMLRKMVREAMDKKDYSPLATLVTTRVTNMSGLFDYVDISGTQTPHSGLTNTSLDAWDVSNVTNMNQMFEHALNFTGQLENWDVSNVTDMGYMFAGAEKFNGRLSNWNVSNVTNMEAMFFKAKAFAGNLSQWNIDKVTNMWAMFHEATAIFQNGTDLDAWCVKNVTKYTLFTGRETPTWKTPNFGSSTCETSTTPPTASILYKENGIVKLKSEYISNTTEVPNGKTVNFDEKTYKVVDETMLRSMVREAMTNNDYSPLATLVTTRVTNMSGLFDYVDISGTQTPHAGLINTSLDAWDVSNVTNMNQMFEHALNFTGQLENWDVSKVTDMSYMFAGAEKFNGRVSTWNIANVTNMEAMFYKAKAFKGNLSSWDVTKVTKMTSMFADATAFIQHSADLDTWCVKNVTNSIRFTGDVNPTWKKPNFGSSTCTTVAYLEKTAKGNVKLKDTYLSNTTVVPNGKQIEFEGVSYKILNETQLREMVADAINNNDFAPLEKVVTSRVTNMKKLFLEASEFNADISKWDVSKVTDMSQMFVKAKKFNSNISSWDVSKVTNMRYMFNLAKVFNQDLSNWDVSQVTTMEAMFYDAAVFNSDLSKWDVGKVTHMGSMFKVAKKFTSDLSKWNVSNVIKMNHMFHGADDYIANGADLDKWCVIKVDNSTDFTGEVLNFTWKKPPFASGATTCP